MKKKTQTRTKQRPKKEASRAYRALAERRKRQPAPALSSDKPSSDQSEAV